MQDRATAAEQRRECLVKLPCAVSGLYSRSRDHDSAHLPKRWLVRPGVGHHRWGVDDGATLASVPGVEVRKYEMKIHSYSARQSRPQVRSQETAVTALSQVVNA